MLPPWTGQKLAVSLWEGKCKPEKQRRGTQAPHPPRLPGGGSLELGGRRLAGKSGSYLMNLSYDAVMTSSRLSGYRADDFKNQAERLSQLPE